MGWEGTTVHGNDDGQHCVRGTALLSTSVISFTSARRHGYFHLTDGEAEAQNSYWTCQGHSLEAAEADLGCVIT